MISQDLESFCKQFPAAFNEIFKKCVEKINGKLKEFYKTGETSADSTVDFPETSSSRDFEYLFFNDMFCDVVLEVEGQTLKAHKVILSSNEKI